LGLAELAKTTLILFYPLWPLLWIVYRWSDRQGMHLYDWVREGGMLALRMAIGLYVVNLGYGFEDSLKPLGKYDFVSKLFAGEESGKPATSASSAVTSYLTPVAHNRFAGAWIGAIPVPFPANYLAGIDVQQRDFEDYGRSSYLRGEWRDQGWWHYYLYAVAIKAPLGLLILGAAAALALCFRRSPVDWRDTFILATPPLVVLIVVSSKTGFSEHMRYVLPCFPFVFVWLSGFSRKFLDNQVRELVSCRGGGRHTTNGLAATLSLTLLLWSFTSSLWIYPHSLSYFNELIGGPRHGQEHLLGSNVDWGQDLRYLQWEVLGRTLNWPNSALYIGNVDNGTMRGRTLPRTSKDAPLNMEDFWKSLHFVSVNILIGEDFRSRTITAHFNNALRLELSIARESVPCRHIGYSIYVYRLRH
jgi:hypothetical protein